MIDITNKINCSGCGACKSICPVHAIKLEEDEEGFDYPIVDKEKCLECGLCIKTCPWLDPDFINREIIYHPQFYSAQLKDKNELNEVSSGGGAWALAKYIIAQGGVVYGACQENVDKVFHIRTDSLSSVSNIRRSKYLQSEINNCYLEAKEDLVNGRLVLFTGTGCQIAGLKKYLGKKYEKLLTADIVCHGVPSSMVWKSYREENEILESDIMSDLIFRDKSDGWDNNQYKITYLSGKIVKEDSSRNPFHRGYLLGFYSRPSCSNCIFNLLPRVSDFTFADYWKYDGKKFINTMHLGVSLVAVNTIIGAHYIEKLNGILELEETCEQNALLSCRHMNNSPLSNNRRNDFWKVYRDRGFYAAWKKFIKEKSENIVKIIFKKMIRGLKNGRLLKGS